ncbi:hypothetical protein DER45DRAFT_580788 [Fusarium avenaceum]|nr:hypothetical protein DER45DRAFT_580788 [Fusarium avenaceum]
MSPARSVYVTIVNQTDLELMLLSSDLDDGEWSDNLTPPTVIPAGQTVNFQAESDGIMTGVQGSVRYDSSAGHFSFDFDDPYSGSNSYNEKAPGGYSIDRSGGGGDNANVTWTITSS